jgi:hypothetical protein
LTAGVWDALTFGSMLAALVFVALYALNTILLPILLFLLTAYIILLLVTAERPSNEAYPWYLAWKAGNGKGWEAYWYGKFRYRLRRYVSKTFRSPSAKLLVRVHTLKVGPVDAESLPTDEVPGIELLLRTFRLKNNELFFMHDDAQVSEIKAQVKALRAKLKESDTHGDAYLRYLTEIYFGYRGKAHDLILAHHEPSVWEWLDRSPTRSKLFLLLVTVLVAVFIWGVLRISGVPVPAP